MSEITTAIEFNFAGEDSSYLTHSIHPYPAKFPPLLPKRILQKYSKPGQTVLDPFCGSGTTLVEARLLGINAIGVDVNGLSILLTKVKCTSLSKKQFKQILSVVTELKSELLNWKLKGRPKIAPKDIEGLDHWFQLNVSQELTYLLNYVKGIDDDDIKDFFKIVLSSIIVKVSNQDSDTRFAAKDKNIQDNYTFELFCKKSLEYKTRIDEFTNLVKNDTTTKLFNADSRNLEFLQNNSVDIIITSPPYANTYDYYLYHKLRKRWLDIDVKFAQYNEIGSRREYSSLKQKKEKWNDDLIKCFKEMNRVLKKNKMAFIVLGDSVIKKELIKIEKEVISFSPKIGFKVKKIISSDLAKHSKIFNPTFAQKGKKEHLIILEKI